MSAVYQSFTTVALSTTNPLVIDKPSGVVDGDLMIMFIYSNLNAGVISINTLSGWTLIRSDTAGGAGAPPTIKAYYKVASSEGSTYSWTTTGGTPTWGGILVRVSGQNATPILASNGAGTNSASTTSLTFADTVTPTNGYQLIFFPVMTNVGSGTNTISGYSVVTSNPSWTEIHDSNSTLTQMSLAYATRDESTATGDSSATASTTTVSYVGQLIVVDRIYAFSSTISDSTTVSDSIVTNTGYNLTVSESVTPTETVTSEKQKTWATTAKSSTTWLNTDKS
jgi:hypothetical protein